MGFLKHVGVKRRSGRYDWGSGDIPYQHEPWFTWSLNEKKLKSEGLSDTDIAEALGISTTVLRQMRGYAKEEKKQWDSAGAYRMKEKGYSIPAIAEKLGVSEGTVRNYLKPHEEVKQQSIQATADMLKREVNKKKYLDVGEGTELYLGCSKDKKNTALYVLKQEGYNVWYVKVEQQNHPGNFTTMKVLVPPGTSYSTVVKNLDRVSIIDERTNDDGRSWFDIKPPINIDSSRIYIRYGEEGGKERDGTIELRRGVEDLSLVDKHYAQVRIAVDGTHYMKGVALYSDDIPKGYDVIYNTNKPKGTPNETVFKPQNTLPDGSIDLQNPFSAVLKEKVGQREYTGKDGKQHLSAINIIKEEGDWEKYKKTIASQMLAKQPLQVAKQQLDISLKEKLAEFNEIMAITNPIVKKRLLASFADDCDASSVHLKAASFPRQASRLLLPLTKIKDTEVYAPGFENGEKVVLIRYPHSGKFEIPELIVNNRNADGRKIIGNAAKDAIGINTKVAGMLSGADFDGDTVLVIPNNHGKIKGANSLTGYEVLKSFDPKAAYPNPPDRPKVKDTSFNMQTEMGKISNLITDMTLKGALPEELVRAVKHSMVIVDAEKHNLDHKTSFVDNRIGELKKKYQGAVNAGASTLISLAKSEARVPKRDELVKWDPETGEKIYTTASDKKRTFPGKEGKIVEKKDKVPRMSLVDDAYELSSGTLMENAYANYANSLKALANRARKEFLSTKTDKRDPQAAKVYAEEVTSLSSKLNTALRNSPIARKANLVASLVVKAKIAENPETVTREEKRKLQAKALAAASARYGARRKDKAVEITPREWEAIQARAISNSMLDKILQYTDLDVVRQYATPRTQKGISSSKLATARTLLSLGYTQQEVADRLSVSVSTLLKYI